MKPITAEWVSKAEGDWTTALRELRARKSPNWDAACFHAQQCVEKYLKAWLVEQGRQVPKIHDVAALLERIEPAARLEMLRPDLEWLTSLAVEVRYPGESAGKNEAKKAVAIAERVRSEIRHDFKIRNKS